MLVAVMSRCVPSAVGMLHCRVDDGAVVGLDVADRDVAQPRETGEVDIVDQRVMEQLLEELDEYFAGTRRDFTVPVRLRGTTFQQQAWKVLGGIPYATTISYGEQARRLGSPRAVRAVGGANGRNPVAIVVPCHRVIGADGRLTGFAGGLEVKAWLLGHEQRVSCGDGPGRPALVGHAPRPAAAVCEPFVQP
jgi:methylated-DNA-[protein]-cysteine S-methyltransferase